MTIKIPKKLYVTYRRQTEEEPRLGFASPYEKNSAFEKRRKTQDTWAYVSRTGDSNGKAVRFKINDDETVVCVQGDASKQFMMKCYPEILENMPLEGFEISKTVTRSGGWSGTNTVWRVRDPRNFELEITSSNLAKIIECSTINDGVIQGKCCWARDGANNLLLPENSEPYKDGIVVTARLEDAIKLKDIPLGSKVTLINDSLHGEYTYAGQYHFLVVDEGYSRKKPRLEQKHLRELRTIKKPIYISSTGQYFSIGSKIKNIVETCENFDTDALIKDLYEVISSPANIDGLSKWVLAISDRSIKADEITVGLEDTLKAEDIRVIQMRPASTWDYNRPRNFICKDHNGNDLIFDDGESKSYRHVAPDGLNFYVIDLVRLLGGEIAGVEREYFTYNTLAEVSDPKVITYTYQNRTIFMHSFPTWLFNHEYN